jgi:hypothetical protein
MVWSAPFPLQFCDPCLCVYAGSCCVRTGSCRRLGASTGSCLG